MKQGVFFGGEKMYAVGDYVVNNNFGVSEITAIGKQTGMDGDFYTISPVYSSGITVGVPVEGAERFIRSLMTKESAEKLMKSAKTIDHKFKADNMKFRGEEYRNMFLSMQPEDWLALVKELKNNVKRSSGNSEYLRRAEDNLVSELAFIFNESRDSVKGKLTAELTEGRA